MINEEMEKHSESRVRGTAYSISLKYIAQICDNKNARMKALLVKINKPKEITAILMVKIGQINFISTSNNIERR